jgi:hypothetical protein
VSDAREALVRLLGGLRFGDGFRVVRVDPTPEGLHVALRAAARRRRDHAALSLLLAPRDPSRAERSASTCRFDVIVTSLDGGELPRPAERAWHDFVAALRRIERRLPAETPIPAHRRILLETRALLADLAARARIDPMSIAWRTVSRWIDSSAASRRHADAIDRGTLAFDLAITRRAGAVRAGITVNERALPDLAARTRRLAARLGCSLPAAAAALSLAARPRLELTSGIVASGADAKLKIYAQETRHGARPISRRDLVPLARAASVDLSRLPARASVACLDLLPGGAVHLKLYDDRPPPLPAALRRRALAFSRSARSLGGRIYFTTRFDPARARHAVNAVFPLRHVPSPLAVTAIGLDLAGDELDLYLTPV